jgi:hypothetical protein
MGYVNNNLLPDETVVYRGKIHAIRWVAPLVRAIAYLGLFLVGAGVLLAMGEDAFGPRASAMIERFPGVRAALVGLVHGVTAVPGIRPVAATITTVFANLSADLRGNVQLTLLGVLATVPLMILSSLSRCLTNWFRGVTADLAVTSRRVMLKTGLVSRDAYELRLGQLESLKVTQGIWGRILGYGTVSVHGTGGSTASVCYVAAPVRFRQQVLRASVQMNSLS